MQRHETTFLLLRRRRHRESFGVPQIISAAVQRLAAGPGESRITADAVAMSMMGAYARRVLRAASMGVNETLELYSRCRVNQVRSVLHLHQVRGGVPRGEGTGAGATGRVCVVMCTRIACGFAWCYGPCG